MDLLLIVFSVELSSKFLEDFCSVNVSSIVYVFISFSLLTGEIVIPWWWSGLQVPTEMAQG